MCVVFLTNLIYILIDIRVAFIIFYEKGLDASDFVQKF